MSIDDRIVELTLQNAEFNQRAGETINILSSLGEALNFKNSIGFTNIGAGIAAGASVANAAISRLTNTAMDYANKVSRMVFDPLVQGGKTRALNIAQAKFQFEGLGMAVEETMAAALDAVKGTAFGLDEAAVVAGQFGASGIRDTKKMTSYLLGISGVAAMAGRSYSDVGSIFTKVAGQGRLMGEDLNRMAGMGINAAANLAKAYGVSEERIRKAVTEGTISFDRFATLMSKDFGEHAKKASNLYTGALSLVRSALGRIGAVWAEAHFERLRLFFLQLAPIVDKVGEAVTPLIKRFNEMADVFRNKLMRNISNFNMDDVTKAMGPLSSAMENVYQTSMSIIYAITRGWGGAFEDWNKDNSDGIFTRIAKAIERITNALRPSRKTVQTFTKAFQTLFVIGQTVAYIFAEILSGILYLVGGITPAEDAVGSLADRILIIVTRFRDWLKEGNYIRKFFEYVRPIIQRSNRLLKELGIVLKDYVVKWFTTLAEFLKGIDWSPVTNFFEKVKEWSNSATTIFSGLFGDDSELDGVVAQTDNATESIGGFTGALTLFLETIETVMVNVLKAMKKFAEFIQPVVSSVVQWISENIDFNDFMDILAIISRLIVAKSLFDAAGGFKALAESVKSLATLGPVGDFLKQFTKVSEKSSSAAFFKIALGLTLVAGALYLLSSLPQETVWSSVFAIATLIGVVMFAYGKLDKLLAARKKPSKELAAAVVKDKITLVQLATSFLILGAGLALLGSAVYLIGQLDADQLTRGLIGIAVTMALTVGAMIALNKLAKPQLVGTLANTAAQLLLIGGAVYLLSFSVSKLGGMPWAKLAKGVVAVAALLVVIAGFMALANMNMGKGLSQKSFLAVAVGISLLSGALIVLSYAVERFGKMDWATLGQGLLGVVTLLMTVGLLANLGGSGAQLITGAIGMLVMSVALQTLYFAVARFGNMDWATLAKGLLGIIVLLTAISTTSLKVNFAGIVGMALATAILTSSVWLLASLPFGKLWSGVGAIAAIALILGVLINAVAGHGVIAGSALLMVGAALGVMAISLYILGQIPLLGIAVGLAAIVVILLVVAALSEFLVLAGAALLLIGEGFLRMGIGILAASLSIVAITAGLLILTLAIWNFYLMFKATGGEIVNMFPIFAKAIAAGIVAFVAELADSADSIQNSVMILFGNIVLGILKGIHYMLPHLLEMLLKIFEVVTSFLRDNSDRIVVVFESLGYFIGKGLMGGIVAGIKGYYKGVLETAKGVWDGIRSFFKVKSPSRYTMDIGNDVGVGFGLGNIDGINSMAGDVKSSAVDMGGGVHEGFLEGIDMDGLTTGLTQNFKDMFDGMDLNPVIKPVVDVSEVLSASELVSRATQKMNIEAATQFFIPKSGQQLAQENKAKIASDNFYIPVSGQERAFQIAKTNSIGSNKGPDFATSIEKAMKELGAMFDPKELDKVNAKKRKGDGDGCSNVTVNQTNNSNKALDEKEIYRNTNNQMSRLKSKLDEGT